MPLSDDLSSDSQPWREGFLGRAATAVSEWAILSNFKEQIKANVAAALKKRVESSQHHWKTIVEMRF